ncbi:MAG: cupin domain-containing protein [Gammaproteobacteria bacterium]|nr:cupin domain-containing protein [Gammaproteobacteria bacterium]
MSDKAKPGEEQWTTERCYITELMNSAAQPEVSIARTRVEPGVTTQLHSLSVNEWYVIEAGEGMMSVADGAPERVTQGSVVAIPKHASQRIENCGVNDLIFLCVCTPRFLQDCYTSLE